MLIMANQGQMQFEFTVATIDGEEQTVTTRPGDIVAWEIKHKETFLTDQVALRQMMWLAWRALYREKRTTIVKFEDWADTVDGFKITDEDDDPDPTEEASPSEDSENPSSD